MAFYVPGGLPEPDDDPDPVRRGHAQFIAHLEFVLESGEQMHELYEEHRADFEARITALEKTVAVLESLVIGETPGGTP
jgi:hypothetical protein